MLTYHISVEHGVCSTMNEHEQNIKRKTKWAQVDVILRIIENKINQVSKLLDITDYNMTVDFRP